VARALVLVPAVAGRTMLSVPQPKNRFLSQESAMTVVRRTSRKGGFTLVEILIVVIILGILAAIVIPQFTSASQDARKNSLTSQLQTMRSQLELYKLQHLDQLPSTLISSGSWGQLINRTNKDGTTGTDPANFPFGPYLQAPPVNSLNSLTSVSTTATDLAAGAARPDEPID
jgi:general secretion pathway protein G